MCKILRMMLMMTAAILSTAAMAFDHDYAVYGEALKKHVRWTAGGNSSVVDYAALKRDPAALRTSLSTFSAVDKVDFQRWHPDQQQAFLINAYNAFTLELILSRYPDLQSIRDLGSLLSSPWKQSFFALLGEQRSLDWIEHQQLRPRYHDARIHFAVNCASIGCPALRPEPYRAASLDAQLTDQQRRFLSDRSRNRFNASRGVLSVSSIFKWYGEDFTADNKGLEAWLASQASLLADKPVDQARIAKGQFKLEYLSYDWTLNASGGQR
ncbi:DUF547 domain-containing protein [Algiphilus sp. W345]|uniref:DUF547 domain-containing protein n=1 Tax=Banduia mediterranea TaxID=3075609 RepID=A0ABU2WH89_9GAMM|nr:DUF547 domain-containing protein [Algiphilus sp. W345]MDT0496636.1 DUF547 domain-containing protein [Algiphilus sp. W345]